MPGKEITLTQQQQQAFETFKKFCHDNEARVFILTGYAGTGKTTLLHTFVKWLRNESYENEASLAKSLRGEVTKGFVPMASTGRAAKVLKDKIGQTASTVHSWIYNFKGFNQDIANVAQSIGNGVGVDDTGQLFLTFDFNPQDNTGTTIYIVDEASMVSDTETKNPTQAIFGSGKLLGDLLSFDKKGKFVFVGDDCQLPPVNGDTSPALSPKYIENHYHLKVVAAKLTDIVRQGSDNDIIIAASRIRQLCFSTLPILKWTKFPLLGYNHIKVLTDSEQLVSNYVAEVKLNGYNSTTLITRSNRSCTTLANDVRQRLGFTNHNIMVGELLLITQNNLLTGLVNGDMVKVRAVGARRMKAQLTFIDVELEEISTKRVYRTMLIEDLLYSNAINLGQYEQKGLYIDFYYREKDRGIKEKSEQFRHDLMTDPFLNALRCVFGYAITCHKAQGGEWSKVFLDIPPKLSLYAKRDAYQWLYTAMTRASDTLYISNGFYLE